MLRFLAAAAAGYTVASVLLERELPQSIPEPMRARLTEARARLVRARGLVREALQAASQATRDAERELMADYRRRSGRSD